MMMISSSFRGVKYLIMSKAHLTLAEKKYTQKIGMAIDCGAFRCFGEPNEGSRAEDYLSVAIKSPDN